MKLHLERERAKGLRPEDLPLRHPNYASAGWVFPRFRNARAGEGIRTLDINLGKVALYQLSYARD